jgi:hypothetical protein
MTSYFELSISPALIKSVGGLLLEAAGVVLVVFEGLVEFDVVLSLGALDVSAPDVFAAPPPAGDFDVLDGSVEVSVPAGVLDPLGVLDGVVPSDVVEGAFASDDLEVPGEAGDVVLLVPTTATLPVGLICTVGVDQAMPWLGGTFAGINRCCVTPYGVAS